MERSTPAIALALFLTSSAQGLTAPIDFRPRLQEADRRAWLTDWYSALPIYVEVEKAATVAGNQRDAIYAKFGRLRGQMQTMSLADASEQIAADLESGAAKRDSRLQLRGLTVKGDIDLEWNVQAAERDWRLVRQLSKTLGDSGWENRANGELGMIAFLRGNTGEATTLVRGALASATQSGDVGGQLRYTGAIANGLYLAGYAPLALGYVERALKLSTEHPEVGFPFVVYSTKVLTLMALNRHDEAEQFAKTALSEARAADRRIKEIELSMMLAQIAERRGQKERALEYLEQAAATARMGHVQRVLADAEEGLAEAYRARGDLTRAHEHAMSAVRNTELAGTRFTLPIRLGILADVEAARGNVGEADRLYDQATDIVEGIMVNVPSRDAQTRLIGVMSNLYAGQFRLLADRLNNPAKAYQVVERARGRALADVLRALPDSKRPDPSGGSDQTRAISQLQLRLIKATVPAARGRILDELWDAEQHATPGPASGPRSIVSKSRIGITLVEHSLAPGEVILEYVLTDPRSYCVVITHTGIDLVPLPSRGKTEELVNRFIAAVRTEKGPSAQSRSELQDAVLRPIAQLQTARRVFVVPDGRLHLVPFDTLISSSDAPLPIVSIVPSASVLFLLRTRRQPMTPNRPLLAVGGVPYDQMFASTPPAAARRSDDGVGLFDAAYPAKLPTLASAETEVLVAARLLGGNSVVLTGDRATESTLKAQNLAAFEILHFAVHAFAEPSFPERAALVLLNDPATGDDGLLQPREIGQFRLNAKVVVLSACDTSVGPIVGQEGILNLARAFLLAGAQSVITTLWAVSDATSTAMMRHFYENLTAGQEVADALMRAKAKVVEQFGTGALATVAAFQVVGLGDQRIRTQHSGLEPTSGRRRP